MRRHQRLGLERQQPGGAREVVAVGLGVDLDLVALDLGVQHVAAAAEVDDVQHVEVLAQLLVGDLEALAHLAPRRACARRGRPGSGCRRARPAGRSARADRRVARAVVGSSAGPPFTTGRPCGAAATGSATKSGSGSVWRSRIVARGARAASSTSSDGSSRRACSPSPSTHATSWRGCAYSVVKTTPGPGTRRAPARHWLPTASPAEVPVRPKSRSTSQRSAPRSTRRAVPSGSPSCQSARCAYAHGSKSSGVVKSCSAFDRVGDLVLDPRQAEDADRVALVRVPDEVELAALVEQVVGVDLALALVVALDRVVLELDRLAAGDGGLDLGEAL